MLNDILTDQEQSLDQVDPRLAKHEEKGSLLSIMQGLGGGAAKGLALPGAALTRPLFGEEATDRAVNNLDNIFKADNLNAAGEFTYSTSTMLGGVIGSNLLTLGAGGAYGTAATYGVVSASAEKADLKKRGLSTGDAWRGGAIKGVTDAVSVGLPTGGIVSNKLADVFLSVGGATGAGALGQYIEGNFIEGVATDEKTKAYGKQLKESAFEAKSLVADSSFGLLLWGLNARTRAKATTDADIKLEADVNDAAHVDVNMEVAEKSNPLRPETPKDVNSHLDKLDEVMSAFKNDQPSIKSQSKVSGTVKPVALPSNALRIRERAQSEGVDPDAAVVISSIETGMRFNADAKNPKSSAHGLFQVLDSTWKVHKGGDRNNVDEQIRVGLKDIKQTKNYLVNSLGRDIEPHEQYLGHLLGPTGAKNVLKANPNAKLIDVVRKYDAKNADAIVNNNGMKGLTVGQAVNKWRNKFNENAAKLGGDVNYSRATEFGLRGSDSNFPQYEVADVQVPEYKSAVNLQSDVMPDMVTPKTDQFELELKSDEFNTISELPTQKDFELMQKTTGYQPVNGAMNTVAYTPTQVDLQGVEIGQRTISELDETMLRQQTNIDSDPAIKSGKQSAVELNTEQMDLSDWSATRSENYVKREMFDNGVTTQALYNKDSGISFTRTIDKDGKASPVKVTKGNRELNKVDNGSPEQTEMQAAATKAIESEFTKPDEAVSAKSFESTPDGREASKLIDSNPDMEVTFTPVTIDGLELEPVTMKASDLKQFIKDQYEEVASDIEAVRVAASCAIKFGV